MKNKREVFTVMKYRKKSLIVVEFHLPTVIVSLKKLPPYTIYKGIKGYNFTRNEGHFQKRRVSSG